MKVLSILVEPAGYSKDLTRAVYEPRHIDHVFMKRDTQHAGQSECDVPILAEMPFGSRLRYFWNILRTYDAVIVNGYAERLVLPLIALNFFLRRPMAFESDTELSVPSNLLKRLVKWLWLRLLFGRSWCYGFPAGRFEHSRNFTYYGMDNRRVVVMPMVVDNDKYSGVARTACSLHKPFVFGFVGRLVALKQVDCIIAALPENAELLVVGDGPERERLQRLSAGKRVSFAGALYGEDKIAAYGKMDALVLYSTHDQWGFVVNEALASGMPVVVSDGVGCRHELVEGAEPTGVVAAADNGADLARAMCALENDTIMYSSYAGNAIRRMQHWDYEYYGQQLDGWLKGLV